MGAARGAGAAARSAHAEDAFKQIREGGAEIRPEIAARPHPAVLEGGMAEAIIGRALVRVLEHFIGFVDLLEFALAAVAGIAVGMILHGELAKRGLELRIAAGARDLQNLVVAALGHPGFLRFRLHDNSLPDRNPPSYPNVPRMLTNFGIGPLAPIPVGSIQFGVIAGLDPPIHLLAKSMHPPV